MSDIHVVKRLVVILGMYWLYYKVEGEKRKWEVKGRKMENDKCMRKKTRSKDLSNMKIQVRSMASLEQ